VGLSRSFHIVHESRIAIPDGSKRLVILSNSSNCHAGKEGSLPDRTKRLLFGSKLTAAFQSMEVRNSTFACFIELLTPNTYVMVVISDPSICKFQPIRRQTPVVKSILNGFDT
jgi:hypothetical protein